MSTTTSASQAPRARSSATTEWSPRFRGPSDVLLRRALRKTRYYHWCSGPWGHGHHAARAAVDDDEQAVLVRSLSRRVLRARSSGSRLPRAALRAPLAGRANPPAATGRARRPRVGVRERRARCGAPRSESADRTRPRRPGLVSWATTRAWNGMRPSPELSSSARVGRAIARPRTRTRRLTVAPSGDALLFEETGNVTGLTPRERQILASVATGKTNAEIAEPLWISPTTVRKHLEELPKGEAGAHANCRGSALPRQCSTTRRATRSVTPSERDVAARLAR